MCICSNDNGVKTNGALKKDSLQASTELLPDKDGEKRRTSKFKLFKNRNLNKTSSSDRKATKTLGVIMGAFTMCWLPFFILAPIAPFVRKGVIPPWIDTVFLWLGYANSFLNPIIYARFNREFRTPFKEIILCRCKNINTRLRSQSYADNYCVS